MYGRAVASLPRSPLRKAGSNLLDNRRGSRSQPLSPGVYPCGLTGGWKQAVVRVMDDAAHQQIWVSPLERKPRKAGQPTSSKRCSANGHHGAILHGPAHHCNAPKQQLMAAAQGMQGKRFRGNTQGRPPRPPQGAMSSAFASAEAVRRRQGRGQPRGGPSPHAASCTTRAQRTPSQLVASKYGQRGLPRRSTTARITGQSPVRRPQDVQGGLRSLAVSSVGGGYKGCGSPNRSRCNARGRRPPDTLQSPSRGLTVPNQQLAW